MTLVYHGTVTGKDDLFLESFIITGAVSNSSVYTPEQDGGFYVSLNPALLQKYGYGHEGFGFEPGRGILVEADVPLDAKCWDFDHEMGYGASMLLVIVMKDFLPKMELDSEDGKLIKQFIDGLEKGREGAHSFNVHYKFPFGLLDEISFNYPRPEEKDMKGYGAQSTYLMQKIHDLLKENFPREYTQAKQEIFEEMAREKTGVLKYIGKDALKVSRIYMEPQDSWAARALKNWEIIYQAGGTKLAASVQQARQIVARAPCIF
jgi:hypothetical protein